MADEIKYTTASFKLSDYKFNEDEYIRELHRHIDATYNSHYSKEQFQATESSRCWVHHLWESYNLDKRSWMRLQDEIYAKIWI